MTLCRIRVRIKPQMTVPQSESSGFFMVVLLMIRWWRDRARRHSQSKAAPIASATPYGRRDQNIAERTSPAQRAPLAIGVQKGRLTLPEQRHASLSQAR